MIHKMTPTVKPRTRPIRSYSLLQGKQRVGRKWYECIPSYHSDRKGGALPIMLQQFRRAIGVCIVRGQAKLKLSWLQYVREIAAEAADICKQNHSNNRWNPNQNGGSSWFSEHCPEGYRTFEQFRNGYDFMCALEAHERSMLVSWLCAKMK